MPTNLPHHLVILQDTPSDVDAVVLPVSFWHVLIHIGVDSSHDAACLALAKATDPDIRWALDRWGRRIRAAQG